MSTHETPSEAIAQKIPPGWRRVLLTILSVLLLMTFLGGAIVYLAGYQVVKIVLESSTGGRLASQSISKAIKVDGDFAPLKLNGWTLTTDSFTSTGWPGEAIGSLNTYGVVAELDPAAVWHGAWGIKGIQIDHSNISLLQPNDALKRPTPPKKPRPWYAHFLPSVFQCGPIVSATTELDFEFQKQKGQIHNARVEADLIGKDFRYTATSGTMEFPYLPPMQINTLKIFVTRPTLTIEDAELTGFDPEHPAHVSLHGTMGQRENKEIDAIVEVVNLPIEQMLPPNLAPLIHGRATGHVIWKRDKTGKDVLSEGMISLDGAEIDDLSVFKQLELLNQNPELNKFAFDKFVVKYQMTNGNFTAYIEANSPGKFSLSGNIGYDKNTKQASIELTMKELPLKVWLPNDFKPNYTGWGWAWVRWSGQLDSMKDSTGELVVNLDGTRVTDPVLLRKFLASKGLRAPDELNFKTAQFDFAYEDETFHLTRANLDVPGVMTASAIATLTMPESDLNADVTWQNLTLDNWLPQKIADQISGDLNGSVKLHVRQWKYKDGSYTGSIAVAHGLLSYTPVQSMVARFVKDRGLLKIPLTRANCSYDWNNGALAITGVDLRGDDAIGITGNMLMDPAGKLSGTLQVGVKPAYLKSLMGLGDPVFARNEAGLRWAKVALSGTAKEPKQDLSKQLMAQLGNHPMAIFGLGGKMMSWYVGNIFGAEDDWKRPAR